MTEQTGNGFDDLGIATALINQIKKLKFEIPTPIQKEAIPLGLQGSDLIALAQTGSGKTMAFGIPMLQRLSQNKHSVGLVIVPTRELAIQVDEALQPLCRAVKIRSAVLIGGAPMGSQKHALSKNPRILIATPGRLLDHVEKRVVNLGNIGVLVLDEADRMLDMGFIPDIKKILKTVPDERQTMLFSATMPKEIEAIAEQFMGEPTRIEVDRSGATPAEVSQEMFFISKQDKARLLAVQIKDCSGPVLVFTRTKWMAKKLTGKVNNMGFSAAQIHSNRTLGQRRTALEGFKRGQYQVLIATDIAARGIDVSGIELVVNYDLPANSEDYVHRIGRTGRAGKKGHAVSYATADQKRAIKDIERFMKIKLDISELPSLPTENMLTKEAEANGTIIKPIEKEYRGKRKSSKSAPSHNRSAKGGSFRGRPDSDKSGSSRPGADKSGSGRPARGKFSKDSAAKDSSAQGASPKHRSFRKKDAEEYGKDLAAALKKRPETTEADRKASKSKRPKSADSDKKLPLNERPFWLRFQKSKPKKKKSVGQGSGRKRRKKSK